MERENLPSGSAMRIQALGCDLLVALPAVAVMWVYVANVLEMTSREWQSFGGVLAAFALLAALGMEAWRRRVHAPIENFLDHREDGSLAPEDLRSAFGAVIAMPLAMQRALLCVWIVATGFIPISMSLFGHTGWFSISRAGSLLVITTSGGLISSAFVYFAHKRRLDPVRNALSALVTDPEERRARMPFVSLTRKIQVALVGTGFASLIFVMVLSYGRAGAAVDEIAADWQMRTATAVARAVDAEGGDLGGVISTLLPRRDLWPYPATFAIYDPAEPASDEVLERLQLLAVAESSPTGVDLAAHTARQLVWTSLSDGRLLYVAVDRDDTRGSFGGVIVLLGGVLVIALVISLLAAHVLADDVCRTTRALQRDVDRMAQGDLRRGVVVESEDELGDLARGFERMGGALRVTVGRVAEAADRVESAAAEITGSTQGVAMASADQVRQLQQANELMLRINEQVQGVSNSAQALNVSVEESSSSILELGAAGDELNETASVLFDRVDEVGSSIEQMVRSVKQVGASSNDLSHAAAETASSMEEMASSMRAVDNTAEIAANLSNGVVQSAEGGQAKVSQTIDGMQAIRDATDRAETVIRGLGLSAEEIGAILDVIDDVADETNLLALNAAIIAAQAGEHGRAFSVVADEIKELADRVLASTKEIGGLIRSVQEESANAVGAIEEGSKSVASGVELSAEAGVSLEEITRSSRESGQHIAEIVSSVREQTKAASHVVALMDQVRNGVEEISRARDEQDRGNEVVFRSSVTMREVAQQVRRTTEEQSCGFGRIRESVEGVREAVEHINDSLGEQSVACTQVGDFLEQLLDGTRSNEEAARIMGASMRALIQQAESLREDVARFQV